MAKDASIRAFKCPSCGAPLEPEVGTLTMKCAYCGGTVIIPESLRTPAPRSGPTMGEVFDFGLNGLDMNQIVGNAMHLPQAITLAQQGRLDEAADIYSRITGMEHADAVESVKAMAAGRAVSLTPGKSGTTWGQAGVTISPSAQASAGQVSSQRFSSSSFSKGPSSATKSSGGRRSCGLLFAIVAGVFILIAILVGGGIALFASNRSKTSLLPAGFASQKLTFGTEGIGPGMFADARSIGMDGIGDITVADYQDGRIQTFDPTGKLIANLNISEGGHKVYVGSLAVNRSGEIYLVHDLKIYEYDATGTQVGEIGDDAHRYNDVTVGGDGKLYAIANDEIIVRFKPDQSIDLEIPDTFTTETNDRENDAHLAVDGVGNMYIVGSSNYLVLKYSADGRFINRFGGEASDVTNSEPGKFTTPRAIAVDGYGRVFVSDFDTIVVFDPDGVPLDRIELGAGPFGLAVDGQNNLYTITTNNAVVKYAIRKPGSE